MDRMYRADDIAMEENNENMSDYVNHIEGEGDDNQNPEEERIAGKKRRPTEEEIRPEETGSAEQEKQERESEQQRRSSKKQTMSAEDYKRAVGLIALYLKTQEEQTQDFIGCPWSTVVEFYLLQFETELNSEEQFLQKQKECNRIIKRMIKHEGIIIVVNADVNVPDEEKLLRLLPSYDP
jgi:hypothetical protein